MMSTDVSNYMKNCNRKIEDIFPKRKYFFPSPCGVFCSSSWLNDNWQAIRSDLKLNVTCGNLPRLYDFRHTFATHRLYQWMQEGQDLNVKLPYLSAYMGHVQLSDTYYYIHLVPEQFRAMSGIDLAHYENLLPEVECDE